MKFQKMSALFAFIAGSIAVFASSATDQKIAEAAKSSYNYRTVLEDHVNVKVADGIVTLTGTVQDKGESDLAVATVENLPGVASVKNDISVKSTYPEKSDSWIALKIRGRLLTKGNVSATATKVVSHEGVVTLTGTADNQAQKELTEVYAREIDGVKSVHNEIVVDAKAPASSTVGEKIDDASITSQLKYALASHKGTSALKTKVTTNDGVISITGEAASDAEKSLVTKLAEDVRGSKSVVNNMTVRMKS